jgi:hypothetical protein
MRRHARILGLVLALAGMGAASATAADAASSAPAVPATTPPGYSVVSANFPLPNGFQTSGSVTCPVEKGVQTVPFSGGAFVGTASLDASISSSFPFSDSWAVDVNNTSGAASQFTVYAVCAKKPKAYVQQHATTPAPADSQTELGAICPKGHVLLGGGARSGSSNPLVSLSSSYPGSTTTWFVRLNNPTSTSTDVTIYRVCGKLNVSKTFYQIVAAPSTDNPAGQLTMTEAMCPGGESVLGGGLRSSGGLGVSVSSTFPFTNFWVGDEGNATTNDASVQAVVLCAL